MTKLLYTLTIALVATNGLSAMQKTAAGSAAGAAAQAESKQKSYVQQIEADPGISAALIASAVDETATPHVVASKTAHFLYDLNSMISIDVRFAPTKAFDALLRTLLQQEGLNTVQINTLFGCRDLSKHLALGQSVEIEPGRTVITPALSNVHDISLDFMFTLINAMAPSIKEKYKPLITLRQKIVTQLPDADQQVFKSTFLTLDKAAKA